MKQGPSHTILAVNDRAAELELLTSSIVLAEYTVLKATNVNAAVRLAIKQQPDLIIINVSNEQMALDLHGRIPTIVFIHRATIWFFARTVRFTRTGRRS